MRSAANGASVAVVCDCDVDGLSAALIGQRSLARLGGAAVCVDVARRGEHVHTDSMRDRIVQSRPAAAIVVDMGSRPEAGGPRLPHPDPRSASAFRNTAGRHRDQPFGHEPTASTSLVAYEVVKELGDARAERWLALLGAAADYGFSLPFPELVEEPRRHPRRALSESIALLNAARRARPDGGEIAFGVLSQARSPKQIASGEREGTVLLVECRAEVQAELKRCSRSEPKLNARFALIRCSSPAQVHPLIARRWITRLHDEIVIVANDGYVPGRVNFAMRTRLDVNLVEI